MRRPPSRGYDSAQSQQHYETRDRYESHQPKQHEPFHIQHAATSNHRNERFVERRDDREFAPRQDDRRSHPSGHFDSVAPFSRPEPTQHTPSDFVRRDGSLDAYFQNLHQERRQDAGYEHRDARPLPPAQQPMHPPPGYYLKEPRVESPRPQSDSQAATWRDPIGILEHEKTQDCNRQRRLLTFTQRIHRQGNIIRSSAPRNSTAVVLRLCRPPSFSEAALSTPDMEGKRVTSPSVRLRIAPGFGLRRIARSSGKIINTVPSP